MKRVIMAAGAVCLVLGLSSPAAAFSMRQALQAVENLGQWSVMAQACGDNQSATDIRGSIRSTLKSAKISKSQRQRLDKELKYWVRTIERSFKSGGLTVETACPIWHDSGRSGVKREFARLRGQLG